MSDLFDQSVLAARAEALLDAAMAAGADAADVIATRGVSLGAQVRLGELEDLERSEADALGLRVIVGQRQAAVSTRDPEGGGFKAMAERAVAMARSAPVDPYAGLASADMIAREMPELDLLDRTEVTAEQLGERARAAEAAGLAVEGITNSDGASASWSLAGLVLMTSEGFSGDFLTSRHGLSLSVIAGSGTAMERDYDYTVAAHIGDLEAADTIGRSAADRALKRLDPRKIETGRMPVVFDPRVATGLVGNVAAALNGSAVARGSSFLGKSLGQKILPDGVTIVDDATIVRGLRSHAFDAEGIAPRRLAIVEDGVAKSYLLDLGTARELGLQTTGHASRGPGSQPSPSTSNLRLEPGATAPEDLIGGIERGFYVNSLFGHGANLVTGDYSRGASGFMIENGRLTYPVSEITIAGNLKDMLKRLVPASDTTWHYAVAAPTILIEEMTVAGR